MLSLVLIVCLLWFLWLKQVREKSRGHALPPAVPGELPVIGHTHKLLLSFTKLWDLIKNVSEDCANKGGVTYFKFGGDLIYLITDPQDALTASNACTHKHYVYDFMKAWMGDGLLISSGEIWKRHRKLLLPAMTPSVMHGFLEVFNSQARKLASAMDPHDGKGLFDHCSYLQDNALETLCVGTFGINPIEDVKFTRKYMESVNKIINMAIGRTVQIWLQNDFIYWLVGQKKKEDKLVKTLHTMTNKILQDKKAALKEKAVSNHVVSDATGNKHKPFLDLLLDLSKNGAMTDTEIREELDTIIAAAFETTSNQLTYTLLLLGAHPEVQEKLYKELVEVLGPDKDVEKDDVNKLVYTNAVLMESLRMIPSVPIFLRNVETDVKLKNYTMRANSHCCIFLLSTYVDQYLEADSDQFKPERWLDGNLKNKDIAAFGLGKRVCIGKTYAMISMKVTLAHFLRRYRVTADMSQLKMTYEFTLKPASGYEISIERRI